MKFVFGLIIGAITTLVIATALDAPTNGALQRATQTWSDIKQTLTNTLANEPSETKQTAVTAPPAESALAANFLPEETLPEATLFEETVPEEALPEQTLPEKALSENAWLEDIVEKQSPVQTPPPSNLDQQTTHPTALPTALPNAFLAADTAAEQGEAIAWSAFHSEASAAGFANRLTTALAHTFSVRKEGAANYLVTYSYADQNQLQELQQNIARITGAPSS